MAPNFTKSDVGISQLVQLIEGQKVKTTVRYSLLCSRSSIVDQTVVHPIHRITVFQRNQDQGYLIFWLDSLYFCMFPHGYSFKEKSDSSDVNAFKND